MMPRDAAHVIDRRKFLAAAAAQTACAAMPCVAVGAEGPAPSQFRLWTMGCAHVGSDRRQGRESLAGAIRQSERGGGQGGPPFDWDIALHVGDISGSQTPPDEAEGREVVRQFGAAEKHRREDFYCLAGNHDASRAGEPTMQWFRTWVDPTGEHTETSGVHADRRPYPIQGTWERYSFRVGNLLFLVMSDRNDLPPPVGRGERGGYPAGAVTEETFRWWTRIVEENPDSIIISAHHHMLRETTVASGPWEGMTRTADDAWRSGYHGYFPEGAPQGASYLYFLGEKPDAQAFEQYLEAHPGAIDLWIGGHTHAHPDDTYGGRSHVERKWGTWFINTAALTRYHGGKTPMSRLLTFTEGGRRVRVQCYLHTSEHSPQGWYTKAERTIELGKAFRAPTGGGVGRAGNSSCPD
jgi:hypothetical protein